MPSQTSFPPLQVSAQGITLTDSARRRFFRKHFSTPTVSYCGIDPEDRKWTEVPKKQGMPGDPETSPGPAPTRRIFGFVARRAGGGGRFSASSGHCNQVKQCLEFRI